MKILKLIYLALLLPFASSAKDYNASLFSIYSDGQTNNTGSIQKAIDYISENGGGRLVFYVGRYITGTVQLKSNVTIKLEEGAIIVGASSYYDYNNPTKLKAIIVADGQTNIGISGKGVIEGNGGAFEQSFKNLISNKYISSNTEKPSLVAFNNCSNIHIDSINLWQSPNAALVFEGSSKVNIDLVNIDSKSIAGSQGIYLQNTNDAVVKNTFLNVANNDAIIQKGDGQNIQLINTIDPLGRPISIKKPK